MAKLGLTDKIKVDFLVEKRLTGRLYETKVATQREFVRTEIFKTLRQANKSGDINTILDLEKAFLENDLANYCNDKGMETSLKNGIFELEVARKLVEKVKTPETYKAVDEAHSLSKNRSKDLPNDEARQFFKSQRTRIESLNKARLDYTEKRIINQRKDNLRTAEKTYTSFQEKALGKANSQENKKGLSL